MTRSSVPRRSGAARLATGRLLGVVSLGLIAASVIGMGLAAAPQPAIAAERASARTVTWQGDNGELQRYQPARDRNSKHFGDFANVSVNVDRTADLSDEAVNVTVSGMPAGGTKALDGYTMGANFVQVMQCWGNPDDPGFNETCQFGATGDRGNERARPPVPYPSFVRGGSFGKDIPFRAVTGRSFSSIITGDSGQDTEMLEVVRAGTSNERMVPVDASGTARLSFETQSAASQPYLGCGSQQSGTGAGTRCWMVVVPRGLHNTDARTGCSPLTMSARNDLIRQDESPINPDCDYWANRIVVPLDFRPVSSACPAGAAERRVVGHESVVAAFTSWQRALCRTTGVAYSLTTSADATARDDLSVGTAQMAITQRPLDASTFPELDPEALADIAYAPVAVSSVGIAFLANNNGKVDTEIRLSPRLIAKLVTQSYVWDQGLYYYNGHEPVPGPWSSASPFPTLMSRDPEFRALNPGATVTSGPRIILAGPNAADAIAQLWSYLQADDKARAFLAGEPDNALPGDEQNTGMTVNRYFLPLGHADAKVPVYYEGTADSPVSPGSRASTLLPVKDAAGTVQMRDVGLANDDGSPLCLCDAPVDTFVKADATLLPQMLVSGGAEVRYDSLQQRPYAATTEESARMLFRADTGEKTQWDPTRVSPGVSGAYIANGAYLQSGAFLTAYTDGASAAKYQLHTAALQAPNEANTFVSADDAGMAAALTVQRDTAIDGVTTTAPAALPPNAYPLTSISYAAVNLRATDEQARDDYAAFIDFAATDGQIPGYSAGELPAGYLPLTSELRQRAMATADAIRAWEEPVEEVDQDLGEGAEAAGVSADSPAGAVSAGSPAASSANAEQTRLEGMAAPEITATAAPAGGASGALGGALIAGLVGAAACPFLLRRRRA